MKKKAKWESENIDTTVILDYVGVHSAFKIFFASAWKTFTIEELQLYTQLHIGLSCQVFFFTAVINTAALKVSLTSL